MGDHKVKLSQVLIVLTAALLIAGSACADVIRVTPANPQGWVWTAANVAHSDFRTSALGGPLPPGAYYGACGQGGSMGNTEPWVGNVWLGTNQFDGVALSEITNLTYSTFTFGRGVDSTHYVKQPFQLQLVIDPDPPSANRRLLMYRPWGVRGCADPSCNPYNQWVTHTDLLTDGIWYSPDKESPDCAVTGECYGNWAWVLANFPNGRLVTTDVSTGWDQSLKPPPPGSPYTTGTGGGLNFVVGARKSLTPIFDPECSANPPTPKAYAWWRESYNFEGYVDNFTIGINGVDTTFDFEAREPGPIVGISGRAARDPLMSVAKDQFRFVVWGKILEDGWVSGVEFQLDDGSGLPIRVYAPGNDEVFGNYARAMGYLSTSTVPPTLSCDPADVETIWYPP